MCEWTWNVRVLVWCASSSLVNVRVIRFVLHWNVRVPVWSMCEWCDNVRVDMECASASLVSEF